MLSTILVVHEDSAPGHRALEHAVRLAELENARLVLVAVQPRQPWLDGGSSGEFLDRHERRRDACQLTLWVAHSYAEARSVPARTETRMGPVTSAIAAAARAHSPDLVVIGQASVSRHQVRFRRTKAERLRRHISCLLVVT